MKRNKEYLNLPVITTVEGETVAETVQLVIDPDKRKVPAIIVKNDEWYKGVRIIPTEEILGVGKDAIIIKQSNNIISYTNITKMEELLKKDIHIIDCIVMNDTGEIKGIVKAFEIDDDYNIKKIIAFSQTDKSNEFEIPVETVSVIAKHYIVVSTKLKYEDLNQNDKDIDDINSDEELQHKINMLLDVSENEILKKKLIVKNKTFDKGTIVTKDFLENLSKLDKKVLDELVNYL